MLKKAAALLLVCVSLGLFVSCGKTTSHFLYASIPAASEIVAYREDPASGFLSVLSVSPITAGPGVQSLVIHPSKKFLYGANSAEGDISLFTIASDGSLTEVTPRTQVLPAIGPTVLAMDSAGSFLYVGNSGSNGSISVFSIDASNGGLSPVSGSPFTTNIPALNIKLSPSGNVLYVTGSGSPNGVIETWSVASGVLTNLIQVSAVGENPFGLVIDSKGSFLYTANASPDNSISEFSINSDGTLTELSGSPLGESFSSPVALLVDPSGAFLYVANEGSANVAAYSVGTSGGLTLLTNSPFASNPQPIALASDPAGKYLFVGNQASSAAIQSFTLDSNTGTLASFANTGVGNTPTSIALTQ
jgi:6-phosphogluconolactonase